ncbi:hypothetical protein ACNKHQ_02305 [Shigella flexneri]
MQKRVTMSHQVLVQLESIAITIVWSGIVAFIQDKSWMNRPRSARYRKTRSAKVCT